MQFPAWRARRSPAAPSGARLKFHTRSHRAYVHITPQVEQIVGKSGVQEGMVLVSAMHITAGVYVNDNESGLIEDIDEWLEKLAWRERITAAAAGHHMESMLAAYGSGAARVSKSG